MGEPVRLALQHTTSSLRRTSGLIAAEGRQVDLIGCKSRMTSRASRAGRRHAVERSAITAPLQPVAWTGIPLYCVFDNLGLLAPHDALGPGQAGPLGSGLPSQFPHRRDLRVRHFSRACRHGPRLLRRSRGRCPACPKRQLRPFLIGQRDFNSTRTRRHGNWIQT
ncbi:hypothetical protein OG462_42230 [Streptomyces sp. NBC_01077]|uniref:hypothetical protein n=1 Tax=Streptomyces sp. NBC_01077 TaxID=2903746 RepID=UPI00386F6F91|nr:hypothetical protein OG462_02790 [Streptomyces sp. NBC_01077]WSV43480.1 hypothetical protein OG462_42230 [Streptomyces sp. NBC_01077]